MLPVEIAALPQLSRLHVQFNSLNALPTELCQATTLTQLGVGGNLWRHDAALAAACEKDVLPIAPFPMHVTPRDIYDSHYTPRAFSPPPATVHGPSDGVDARSSRAGGAAFASALLASLAPGRRSGEGDAATVESDMPTPVPEQLGRYVTRAYTATVLRGRALAQYMRVLEARRAPPPLHAAAAGLPDAAGAAAAAAAGAAGSPRGRPSPTILGGARSTGGPGPVGATAAAGGVGLGPADDGGWGSAAVPAGGSTRGASAADGGGGERTAEDPARLAERRLTAAARRMGSRYLDLSSLELRTLPVLPRLPSLTDLDVSSNGLSVLPPSLYDMRSLKRLVLRRNELVTIDAPWSTAGHRPPPFPALVALDVSDNRLARLPDWIGSCVGLSMLIVSANPVRVLPPCLLECVALTHFIARATKLPPASQAGGIGLDAAAAAVAAGVASAYGVA